MAMSKLYTPRARLAFVQIARSKQNDKGEDRWGCALLFEPERFTSQEKVLWQAIVDEAKARLAELQAVKGKTPKLPFKKGETKQKEDGSFFEGFGPGVVFFDASTKRGPHDQEHPLTLVDAQGEPLEPEAFYSGCYARAKINSFTYTSSGNRGVSFGLLGLQWLADGERFGGGGSYGFEDAPPVEGAKGSPQRRAPTASPSDAAGGASHDEQPPEREGAWAGDMNADDIPF